MKKNSVAGVFVVSLFISLLFAPYLIGYVFFKPKTQRLNGINIVTKYSSITFPPSSKLIDGYRQCGLKPCIIARVNIDQTDVKAFLGQNIFGHWSRSNRNDILTNSDMFPLIKEAKWTLSADGTYICYGTLNDVNDPCFVMVDLSSGPRPTVYVAMYE
jgi:hypothetical protein